MSTYKTNGSKTDTWHTLRRVAGAVALAAALSVSPSLLRGQQKGHNTAQTTAQPGKEQFYGNFNQHRTGKRYWNYRSVCS